MVSMVGDTLVRDGFWSAPREFDGQRVYILGGGYTLHGFDPSPLRQSGGVIACNSAGLTIAPWADVLIYGDERWLEWNVDKIHLFSGRHVVSRSRVPRSSPHPRVRVMHHTSPSPALSVSPSSLSGHCTGGSAINLAFLMGAVEIVLLGYDMRPGNFHDMHRVPPEEEQHALRFIPAIEAMAPVLVSHGVRVINSTPHSELRCFEYMPLSELAVH